MGDIIIKGRQSVWGLDEVGISDWRMRGGHAPYMGITRSPLQ